MFQENSLANCGNPCPKHTRHKLVPPGCSKISNLEGGDFRKTILCVSLRKMSKFQNLIH
jgi:hypothetical protein